MILDALTHVTPDGRWFDTSHDASETRLLRELDAAGVERAVVVALAGFIRNDFVLELCRRHPGRLVPGASFDPSRYLTPRDAIKGACAELVDGGPFAVLKLHPRLNRYDVLDPRCLGLLEHFGEWLAPPAIWIDTLIYSRGATPSRPLVDTFHHLVGRFPKLRFVLLHAGGPWALQLAAVVRDCPNVWLDLSFTLHRYRGSGLWLDLEHLARTFDRRLIFGSDFPEVSIADALADLEALTAGIDDERRERIAGGNLRELLAEREKVAWA